MTALHHAPLCAPYFPVPALIRCKCCGDDLDADDFHPELFRDYHARAVETQHTGPVCTDCMDRHVVCEVSGAALMRADAWQDRGGVWFASKELMEKWGQE